jgi:hypothetical protein
MRCGPERPRPQSPRGRGRCAGDLHRHPNAPDPEHVARRGASQRRAAKPQRRPRGSRAAVGIDCDDPRQIRFDEDERWFRRRSRSRCCRVETRGRRRYRRRRRSGRRRRRGLWIEISRGRGCRNRRRRFGLHCRSWSRCRRVETQRRRRFRRRSRSDRSRRRGRRRGRDNRRHRRRRRCRGRRCRWCRCRGRRRRSGRRRERREEAERIEVALVVRVQADAQVNVRNVELGRPARPDRPDRCTLGEDGALGDSDRAEMRERDGERVRREDRDALAARGHRPCERHLSGGGRDNRRSRRGADVDAAMLATRVRVRRIERERREHRSGHGPRPRARARDAQQRKRKHHHAHPHGDSLLLSRWKTRRADVSDGVGCCQC